MKVALIHDVQLPVQAYGGTERVIWWLAKGLHQLGIQVTLVCRKDSQCPFAGIFPADFSKPIEPQLPEIDLYHYFTTPPYIPSSSYLVTIGGNGQMGEIFLPNTVFVSQNHAHRHGSNSFVYNGIDPDDYFYSEDKKGSLLFLAKASWKVKNVKGAIRIARASHKDLNIVGGKRTFLKSWRGIHWRGFLDGTEKAQWISQSSALLFPVLWDEPFGIAVIEALVSGTPVLASKRGSLPELIHPEVGRLCGTETEFIEAIQELPKISAARCKDWAISRFSYQKMAQDYLKKYEQILSGKILNSSPPTRVGKDFRMSLQSD